MTVRGWRLKFIPSSIPSREHHIAEEEPTNQTTQALNCTTEKGVGARDAVQSNAARIWKKGSETWQLGETDRFNASKRAQKHSLQLEGRVCVSVSLCACVLCWFRVGFHFGSLHCRFIRRNKHRYTPYSSMCHQAHHTQADSSIGSACDTPMCAVSRSEQKSNRRRHNSSSRTNEVKGKNKERQSCSLRSQPRAFRLEGFGSSKAGAFRNCIALLLFGLYNL